MAPLDMPLKEAAVRYTLLLHPQNTAEACVQLRDDSALRGCECIPLRCVQIVLAKMGFDHWLEAHGKMKRKDLTKKQEIELKECFELIDTGGSGNASFTA